MFNGIRHAEDWKEVSLRSNPLKFYIPNIQAHVGVGEFVLVQEIEQSLPAVAQIIDVVVEKAVFYVLLNWFSTTVAVPPLEYTLPNLLLQNQEVVQTNSLEWINANRVKSICFVFHYSRILNGCYDCFGIKFTYFIRYRALHDDKTNGCMTESVSTEHYTSFPKEFGATYSQRIWCGISTVQGLTKKALHRVAESQPMKCQFVIPSVTHEFFTYLQSVLQPVTVHNLSSNKVKKLYNPDLSLESVRQRKHDLFCIRIATTAELMRLRSVFGARFGVGVKKKHPSIEASSADNPVYCRHSDNVNIVVADDQQYNMLYKRRKFLRRVNCPGFDFLYDPEECTLVVQCRFRRYRGSSSTVKAMVSLPCRGSTDIDHRQELVTIGESFFRDGVLFRVLESSVSGCLCVSNRNNLVQLNLTQLEVRDILRMQRE